MSLKRRTLVFLFFMLAFSPGPALHAQEKIFSIEKAHECYKHGNYEAAKEIYEAFLKDHPDSEALHYDLGNVYYKLKKIGLAILHYEKARSIKPHDYEINENLAYLQGLIEYKLEDKRNWYWIQWSRFLGHFTWNELVFLSLALYLAFMGLLTLRFLLRKELRFLRLARPLFFLFLLSLAPLLTKYWYLSIEQDAVVISPTAEVRYGPSDRDRVAFRLVEGLKVEIEETRGEWYRVGLVNGESGWCEKKDLERI